MGIISSQMIVWQDVWQTYKFSCFYSQYLYLSNPQYHHICGDYDAPPHATWCSRKCYIMKCIEIWSGVNYLRYGPGGGRICPRLKALKYHLKLQLFAMTLYK